jgi:hypothetical protein
VVERLGLRREPATSFWGIPNRRRGSLVSVSVDLTDDDQGGVMRFAPNGPDAEGWVVEVLFRPPRSSNPGRPLYWHGPPTCQTSNLNESVAVFPDA